MKKRDQNITIILILTLILFVVWFLSRYNNVKQETQELKEAQIEAQDTDKIKEKLQKQQNNQKEERIIETITPTELNKQMKSITSKTFVLDLRSPEEYLNKHIRNSVHLNEASQIRSGSTIVFVTRNGAEDSNVLDNYEKFSATNTVYNLSGGINAWENAGLPIISFNIEENFENNSKINLVEPRDLNTLDATQRKKITILDVRRDGNYERGHIPEAVNIPFIELEKRIKELPLQKKVYVYGANEEDSFRAGVLLYDLNVIGAQTINGGFAAWKKYGYPIETTSSDEPELETELPTEPPQDKAESNTITENKTRDDTISTSNN